MAGLKLAVEARRPTSGDACRVTERFPCDVAASCQPPSAWRSGDRDWPARIRDLSTGGLCLVLGRRFEPGAGLAVEAPSAEDGSPSILLVRVVNVRANGPGSWALGCALVSPLSDEELQGLVRVVREVVPPAVVAPSTAEKPFIADVHFRGALPHGGGVVERVIRKLYVKRSWPLAPGRTIGLRFRAFSDDPVVRVRVDACRASGGRRVLECTFVDAPPAGLSPFPSYRPRVRED